MNRLVLVLSFLFLYTAATSQEALAKTLTLVADSWCPYNCEPDSEKPGVLIEIAQKAFERHNIQINYQLLPWARSIAETRAGKFDAIVGASKGDAPDFIFPAHYQAQSQMSFFVKPETEWRYETIESLKNTSLGTIADYSYNEEIDGYIELHKRDPALIQQAFGDQALETNIKKLLGGRIKTLIEDKNVMFFTLSSSQQIDKVKQAGSLPLSPDQNLFIAFSPADPKGAAYAAILDEETRKMQETGELQAIYARYGLSFSQPGE